MIEAMTDNGIEAGLCILIVIGGESANWDNLILSPSDVHDVSIIVIVKVVVIPEDDQFELTKAINNSSNSGAKLLKFMHRLLMWRAFSRMTRKLLNLALSAVM